MIHCKQLSHVYFATSPLPTVAHISIHSVYLAFGPKSGFKNKCRVRASQWGGPFTTLCYSHAGKADVRASHTTTRRVQNGHDGTHFCTSSLKDFLCLFVPGRFQVGCLVTGWRGGGASFGCCLSFTATWGGAAGSWKSSFCFTCCSLPLCEQNAKMLRTAFFPAPHKDMMLQDRGVSKPFVRRPHKPLHT